MATRGDRCGEELVAPAKDCGQTEYSAVLLKADEQSTLSRELRSNLEPAPIPGSLINAGGSLKANPGRWGNHQVPLESQDSLPLTITLRI
jgi:hypothetical protein